EINESAIVKQLIAIESLDPVLLEWLNKNISLDNGELEPGSLQLKLEHIAALCHAIEKSGIKNQVMKMDSEKSREFINNCGRALQCYSSESSHKFASSSNKAADYEP